MKYYITAVFLFTVLPASAYAESNVEKYKKVYVEQIKPILKEQFAGALEKEADPEAKLQFVAEGMADCQSDLK